MANISRFLQPGEAIDYTPAATTYAGNIVNLGALSGLTPRDIAASALGALHVQGVIQGPYVGGAANIGDNVWWDANGTPYGGAADGAFTTAAAAGDWWVGTLTKATVAASATCDIALNVANPNLPAWPNREHVTTAIDLTYVAATHNSKVLHVTASAKTLTLPTGVAGMEAIWVNDNADGVLTSLTLDGVETCEGRVAIGAGETAGNTALTANRGDYLHLVCQTAASLWRCVASRGTWLSA